MRFILLGINVALFVVMGIYLADMFSIKAVGIEAIAFLFAAAVAGLAIANEMVEEQKIDNTAVFLLPGIIAMGAPFLAGTGPFGLAVLVGVLLTIPGLVVLVRKLIR